jgi:hypothetical protein
MDELDKYIREREQREPGFAALVDAKIVEIRREMMGTNFYFNNAQKRHIGKRSVAGWYCHDCHRTLCKKGESGIHYSESEWFEKCPMCGKDRHEYDQIDPDPVGVELGFAKPLGYRPNGVTRCSSFRWAITPFRVLRILRRYRDRPIVKNEYDEVMTGQEFLTMLKSNCPVQYIESINKIFS